METPERILEFALGHAKLVDCKKESLEGIEGDFYTLNYTEEANQLAPELWDPITLICRGLVIRDNDDTLSFSIVPHPKFFSWPRGLELPDPVVFRRKVDGSCVHCAALRLHGADDPLTWLVGTRCACVFHVAMMMLNLSVIIRLLWYTGLHCYPHRLPASNSGCLLQRRLTRARLSWWS